jgi:hypothetical protein
MDPLRGNSIPLQNPPFSKFNFMLQKLLNQLSNFEFEINFGFATPGLSNITNIHIEFRVQLFFFSN